MINRYMTVEEGCMTISVMNPSSEGFCNLHKKPVIWMVFLLLEFFFNMKFFYKAHNKINLQFIQVTLIVPFVVNYPSESTSSYYQLTSQNPFSTFSQFPRVDSKNGHQVRHHRSDSCSCTCGNSSRLC